MSAEFFNGAPVVVRLPGIAQPELPDDGNGYIYFDLQSGKLMASENGGPYVDLIASPAPPTPSSIIETPNTLTFVEVEQAVGPTGGDRITLRLGASDPNRQPNVSIFTIDSNLVQMLTPSGTVGDTSGTDFSIVLGSGHGTGNGGNFTVVAGQGDLGNGGNVYLFAGPGGTNSSGGSFQAASGGVPTGSNQSGGVTQISSGSGDGTGSGGTIQFITGDGGAGGSAGNILFAPSGTGAFAGNVNLLRFSGTGAVELRFWDDAFANYTALRGPTAPGINVSLRLPASDGAAKQAIVTDGAGTLSFGNVLATNLDYTPGTPANWVGPAPTTVQQALDRLAAKVAALNGGPIP